MSTTPATHAAHVNAPASATGQRAQGAQGPGQRANAPDLFATLLALAADTAGTGEAAPLDAMATEAPVDGDNADAREAREPGSEHPLAGLLLWQPPGLEPRRPGAGHEALAAGVPAGEALPHANTLAADTTAPAAPANTDANDAANPPANASANARPAGPSWQVMAARAAQAQPQGAASAGTPAAHGQPAMHWSRAATAEPGASGWAAVRSTVTLDTRFPATAAAHAAANAAAIASIDGELRDTSAPTGTVAGGATGSGPSGPAAAGTAGQADLAGGQGEHREAGERAGLREDTHPADGDPYAAATPEDAAVDVQHWQGAHGLRHASLRVGEDAARAIDIQLALRGDELRLDIRTDDSVVRDALREQAQAALGERLQQGGLQLADVSVGAQQQERQREGHTPAITLQAHHAARTDAAADAPAARPQPAPRSGGQGLDLFI